MPRNRSCSYTRLVKFTCPRCGKKYASADEPVPGRVYSLTCRCGTKITVKGPEARTPGAPVPEPSPGKGFDLFPTERRRVQGGAPVSNVDAGSLPLSPSPRGGEPTSSSSWASQTTRVPLREATPPPATGPAARAPAAPGRAAPRPAAPLDPFADMPDLQADARGEARPLTSVPEIHGPLPEPPASPRSYDPFAAQHGLLLDEREARAIAGQAPVLEPPVEPAASDANEPAVSFSDQMPAAPKRRARAVVPRVASRGPSRVVLAVAAFVVVGGGAGAAWLFLGRTRSAPPTQAVSFPPPAQPAPSPPPRSAPVPVPSP
ncbi:MAG TPA: hypothetical protein VFI16_00155, partial [Anaeromyxobacteraceae bacterium]|nr:hypothetical protein [Anaeromyxobacteraceae bacterium]